jgi:hypothetical protein
MTDAKATENFLYIPDRVWESLTIYQRSAILLEPFSSRDGYQFLAYLDGYLYLKSPTISGYDHQIVAIAPSGRITSTGIH